MTRTSRIASLVVLLVLSPGAFAQTTQAILDFQIHQPYTSPRALGMGNAFTALADDPSALFYNPAGLARMKEGNLNLFVGAGADGQVQGFVDDVNTAMDSEDKTTDLANLISNNYGKHYWARATPLGLLYARPKWGFAFIPLDLSVDFDVRQQIGPTLNVIALNDSTFAFGFAKTLKSTGSHEVSIGMTIKPMYRAYYGQSVPAPQLAMDEEVIRKELAQEGATIDADLGLLWTLPTPKNGEKYLAPTLGLVVRNAADYGFTVATKAIHDTPQKPPKLQRRFDVGTKFELPRVWVFSPRFLLDERDIGHRNFTMMKGLHAGFELNWKVRSWLHGGYRFGINQGYWTGGISAALGIFMLEFATWGEEIGTTDAKKENRRYTARASLDF